MEFLANAHLWIKAFHIVAVVAWMAGMLYLPRLFVYHADTVTSQWRRPKRRIRKATPSRANARSAVSR